MELTESGYGSPKTIAFFNEDCRETMKGRIGPQSVDVILTSPWYNTNKKAGKARTLTNTSVKEGQYNYVRYDVHVDNMTDDEYADFTVGLFQQFDTVLKPNGSVLYNLSYGAENTECMFKAINAIITRTNFTVVDVICWKKKSALPNSCSSNRLTRITEYVFVCCRKSESKTFFCNKRVKSLRKTGQKAYENVFNFVEAKNNDGPCPYNKATFSSDLCAWLLNLYAPTGGLIYDPFMGSGTTAVACKTLGLRCIGSEISANQVAFSKERLEKVCRGDSRYMNAELDL